MPERQVMAQVSRFYQPASRPNQHPQQRTNLATIYGKLVVPAGNASRSQFNLAVSVAPTTPSDGDIWLESNSSTGLKIKLGGVIYKVSLVV